MAIRQNGKARKGNPAKQKNCSKGRKASRGEFVKKQKNENNLENLDSGMRISEEKP